MIVGSVLFYTFCVIVTYIWAKRQYAKTGGVSQYADGTINTKKMTFFMIVILALLCAAYNWYVTTSAGKLGGDRTNYLYDFEYGRVNPSVGLTLIYTIAHSYNINFYYILYFSTFVGMALALLAYRYSKDASPYSLLLFMLTPYLIFSFSAIKQVYTDGCSCLIFALLLNDRSLKRDIICGLLIFVAMMFHPTGFILVPIYLVLRLNFKIKNNAKVFFCLVAILLFLKPILLTVSQITSNVAPFLSNKIDEYFVEGKAEESGYIVLLKGLPYYCITYLGMKYRRILCASISNYDKYLLLSMICSCLYIATLYDYWMSRFIELFSFIVLMFWGNLVDKIKDGKIHRDIMILMIGLLTYRHLVLIYINYGYF